MHPFIHASTHLPTYLSSPPILLRTLGSTLLNNGFHLGFYKHFLFSKYKIILCHSCFSSPTHLTHPMLLSISHRTPGIPQPEHLGGKVSAFTSIVRSCHQHHIKNPHTFQKGCSCLTFSSPSFYIVFSYHHLTKLNLQQKTVYTPKNVYTDSVWVDLYKTVIYNTVLGYNVPTPNPPPAWLQLPSHPSTLLSTLQFSSLEWFSGSAAYASC